MMIELQSNSYNFPMHTSLWDMHAWGGCSWLISQNDQIFRCERPCKTWVKVAGSLSQIDVGDDQVWGVSKSSSGLQMELESGNVSLVSWNTYRHQEMATSGEWIRMMLSINAHALENGFTLAGRSSKQIDGGHISMCTVSTRIMICSLCEWTKHLAGDILLVRN